MRSRPARSLASALARVCSASTSEGTLWPVDAALRPEGKDGPLVRTVASHRAYYERWAATWEFQALLKARPVAGDAQVGRQYVEAITPLVWEAAGRENFVRDVQAMRRRVEAHVPSKEVERQLKLGPGGLRDVEFSVQLLQMVHGRAEERLRTPNTLEGLELLSTYGYVGRDDAGALDTAYRDLRVLEHRLQLARLRRTHVMPENADDRRRLARAARLGGTDGLDKMWRSTRAVVRPLHERLFYRPVLAAAARLTADEARLTPDAARTRLQALGYTDPAGAMRHLEALTEGVSRRAAIQRQLLPVLLGWFAEGADPDGGLLAFRQVSDALGTTHWYLKMLRDSGAGAERIATVLSGGQYAATLLARLPEATRWLGSDEDLAPRPPSALSAEVATAVARHRDPADAVGAARSIRAREMLRTALGDLAGVVDLNQVGAALSTATVATLEGALAVACRTVGQERSVDELPTRVAVIGMGRLGGLELGYGSDADVVFVHQPRDGADEQEAQDAAFAVVTELQKLLRAQGASPTVDIDTTLRPEGRDGALVRSLDSYAEYYRRWSAGWEAQALLRADFVAGDPELGRGVPRAGRPAALSRVGHRARRSQGAAADQGTCGVRTSASRREPGAPPEAGTGWPGGRRVDGAAPPAAARRRARRAAHDVDAGRTEGGRAPGPGRHDRRGDPRARLGDGLAPSERAGAVARSRHRRDADDPSRPGRRRAAAGVRAHPGRRAGGRRAARDAPRPLGGGAALLRLTGLPASGTTARRSRSRCAASSGTAHRGS